MPRKERVSVYLTQEQKEWLENYSEKQGTTVSEVIRDLVVDLKHDLEYMELMDRQINLHPIMEEFLQNISAERYMKIDSERDLVNELEKYIESKKNK